MIFLGYVTSRTYLRWPDPPRWLANFSFYEHHQSAPIAAEPGTIIQAVQNLDMTADPIINALLKLRKLPGRCYQRFTQHPSPHTVDVNDFGFATFTPLHQTSRELVLGLTGQFWRPTMAVHRLPDAEAFARFNEADAAKLILCFRVVTVDGEHRLVTETFVHCPTPRVKRRFACYWGVIRPASGWIRRRTLLAVQRQLALENGGG